MSKRERKHKSDQQLSLWSLSMPFLFMALANFAASIINTLVLALVPNNGIIYSEAVGVASKILISSLPFQFLLLVALVLLFPSELVKMMILKKLNKPFILQFQ